MSHTVIAILSLVVLVALVLAFMFFYFRALRSELREEWLDINDKLRVRLDKIPNLIETIKGVVGGQDSYIDDFIGLRARSWPMGRASREKVQIELEISEKIHHAWRISGENDDLKHNINYLALKTEFKEIGKEIEQMTDEYNKKVRDYNRIVDFPAVKFPLIAMRFRRLPIFEFEP